MNGWRNNFLERLFRGNRSELISFLRRRTGAGTDAADLAQEVYLRLLRARNLESIRDPQAYLYAVAANLVRENAIAGRWRSTSLDLEDSEVQERLSEHPQWDQGIDRQR